MTYAGRRGPGRRALPMMLLLLIAAALLGGCAEENTAAAKRPLKIAVVNEDWYRYFYGDYIEAAFPDQPIELIVTETDDRQPPTYEQYKRQLAETQPDLILDDRDFYRRLAEDGLLADLSVRMKADGMDEKRYLRGMLEGMKVGGQLYGLSPWFDASFLTYNEDLFRRYGIDPPRSGMTMAEVLALADEFARAGSAKDGIYGYHENLQSMPYDHLFLFAFWEGIRMYNADSGKVTLNTPAWERIAKSIIDAYRSGTFYMQNIEGRVEDGRTYFDKEMMEAGDLFGQGKAAMTIGGYREDGAAFKIGQVAGPVSSANPGQSATVTLHQFMGVYSSAEQPDRAWEVIRFMMSDYVAKASVAVDEGRYTTNRAYLDYRPDPIVSEAYELLPMPYIETNPETMERYDWAVFHKSFEDMIDAEMTKAINGERTAAQAMSAIQKEGQALLDGARRD
ncbi:extracellular solute-binding protein [Paenibacillus methanolicus]|uniref:ABC-type glycerol-3-phosphate transport system substrate-binding protein n=1 Tax=Paenibacillus methanolicus TaxID=582686 RepID=A0A5S5BXT9_9BACL|nr:extracellular solute-binding protein [Paenibacillus methanolicus]TYP71857.1 ABC-type glycerol-3-phosphate transport system substrate-binding protein [Paenibacillus methanolicus]